ncbi:MAG TPA: nucleoside-diphosphate kinase [Firmicutes bacterium]|jgi:nucleoside-diphosphate kinase|nr:nucleoside-diphosphate kinase [Bacillota bacterium]
MPRNNGDWRKDSGTKCRKGASLLTERTLVILKPDALQRALAGEIISRLEKKGFILVGAKLFRFDEALCRRHYAHLVDKPFFPEIVDYMTSGPCLAMVWQGPEVIAFVRSMIGPTNPLEAAPGTIRGDYGISTRKNVIHASDSLAAAEQEIQRFFPEGLADEQLKST